MAKVKLPLSVLYSDGTVSVEYDKNKKIVAVVVGNTFIALRDSHKDNDQEIFGADWQTIKDFCEGVKEDGYCSYMPPYDEVLLWRDSVVDINLTIGILQQQGVNADMLFEKNIYWTSTSHHPFARAVNFYSGNIEFRRREEICFGRAAIRVLKN